MNKIFLAVKFVLQSLPPASSYQLELVIRLVWKKWDLRVVD
jgi:hypothetical protein